jgi:hypothetical protein
MNIDQFSHNRLPERPFHSSGYAKVSQGNTLGSTNAQTFGDRAHIEKNRSAINGYRASMVGQGYVHQNMQSRTGGVVPARPTTFSALRPGGTIKAQPRPTFREPPTRYNPFS